MFVLIIHSFCESLVKSMIKKNYFLSLGPFVSWIFPSERHKNSGNIGLLKCKSKQSEKSKIRPR